jgi:uncharacterized repeat protein (TIGR01451 family)
MRLRVRALTAVAAVVAVVASSIALASPAVAADEPAQITVNKTVQGVDAVTVAPGDEFTYTIRVGCNDNPCINAHLDDVIPAQFAGFAISNAPTVTPSNQPSSVSLTGCTTAVTASCDLGVDFTQSLAGGEVGIDDGTTYTVSISLKAPQNLAPTWQYNDQAITNTANATARNSTSATDGADVTVHIPVVVDEAVGKTWSPATQQYAPGAASTVTLTTQNLSNLPAATLALQDPQVADEGAGSLAAGNPFDLVDFSGFGGVTAPQGADQVQVDAYVFDGTAWHWITGTPSTIAGISLPGGVVPADVGGLRVTFSDAASGATIAPSGTAGSVAVNVTQRATTRAGGALVQGGAVTNTVAGTVTVPGEAPKTETASAPYAITGLDVNIGASKSITPARVPAGVPATATISAQNNSNGPVTQLSLDDSNYFTDNLRFNGFTAPLGWPTGATSGTVTWHFSDGSQSGPTAFASGSTPAAAAAPAGEWLTGFTLDYAGSIPPSQSATAQFSILPAADMVTKAVGSLQTVNTVTATGSNPAGDDSASATAPLDVYYPDIHIDLTKSISPSGAVTAGGTVVAKLGATTSTQSQFVDPDTIVVEDVLRPGVADDFWNAFDAVAIAPTAVPAGSQLLVEYTTDGTTWTTLTTVDATAAAQVYSAPLPAGVVGVRFTFTDANRFPQSSTVAPNLVFQARSQLRDGSGPTATAGDPAEDYTNHSVAHGSGTVEGPTPITSDPVSADADAHVIAFDGTAGSLGIQKRWVQPGDFSTASLPLRSQSGDQVGTVLDWAVRQTGFDSVTISDPSTDADADTPEDTAFEAFDLLALPPVSSSVDPLLKWDTVQSVQLRIAGSWQTVTAPAGGWMSGGGFVGYTLTSAQSAAATGVRLVVVPNDAARAASSDPTRPQPGSGVTTSSTSQTREFRLLWKLRNVARVPGAGGPWVTGSHGYNVAGDADTISNTAAMSGQTGGTTVGPVTDSDTISLTDLPPTVDLTKSASPSKLVVPEDADVPPADYPTATFTLTAQNTSPARASYLRVTDPALCSDAQTGDCASDPDGWSDNPFTGADYDPATNPFETTTLTKIAFTLPGASVVDQNASTVTLWHRAGDGTLSTTTVSVAAAQALTASQLADVVGVSVLYQGTDPASTGGSIDGSNLVMTLTAQLRVFDRSAPTVKVSAQETPTINDRAFAQSYDPVLAPTSAPRDIAAAGIPLASGVLGIATTKTISPGTLLEKDRTNPVSVTLSANDGTATVATERVTLVDTTPEFWNTFRLTGLGTVQLPAGADTVQVDVQLNGDSAWIPGTPAATAALPSVPLDQVTGIRFVFWHTGDTPFSTTVPPQHWTASAILPVKLRDTQRDGSPIVFPTTVDDTLTATSERTDNLYSAKSADDDATITLDPGTFQLDVSKTPLGNVHTVAAGDSIPWTLVFHNTGTGYLDVTQLVDTLDDHLDFDGADPTFTDSAGGGLSATPSWDYSGQTRQLTVTWPQGQRMAPGETFTITAGFILLPGLTANQTAVNQFVVDTEQTLSACTNTSGNGQGVLGGLPATDCGTSNFVQPQAGASLLTTKGSRGEAAGPQLVSGATNVSNPAASPNCTPDSEGFYRNPCAANSVVGATDEWKLTAQNSGTVAYKSLVLVDPLPVPGDRMLATGGSRGSTYRPVLDGAFGVDLAGTPAGTTIVEEVTTAADACWGTGTSWNTDSTCATHPASGSWTALASYTGSWAAVTAVRIRLDFTTSPAGSLAPGATVTAKYRTINQPATTALPTAAPVTPTATPPVAWNQYGATVVTTSNVTISRAPSKAGVILPTGSIQLQKAITGAGSGYAPDDFVVDVACTIAGVAMDLGPDATRTLTKPALLARIDGLPLGAHCTVDEHGAVGSFGETSRSGVPVALDVTTATVPGDNVPVAQTGTITNDYALSGLTIAKTIDTDATVGVDTMGPFAFTVACESVAGGAVTLAAGDASFTLGGGEVHPISGLPIGATCTVTETDADGATTTAIAGTGVTDHGDGSAAVVVQPTVSTATVTNHYDTGTLSVLKVLAGSGADSTGVDYGAGPFSASVSCTYGGQTIYTNPDVAIVPGTATPLDENFPVGTVCAVAEVQTGGANSHDDPPAVTITAGDGTPGSQNTVADVTNHFLVGSLHIVKERTGAGVPQFGDGPFTAHVECTWQRDGQTVTIPLPDAGDVTLDKADGYEATVDDLLVGASCVVTETDAGLAVATTLDPVDGTVTILDPATLQNPVTVTITNEFRIGRLELQKTADTATAKVGQAVGYTIRVTNTGGVEAKGATVTDVLPAGATVVSASDGGVVTGDRVVWTVVDLDVGASVSYHLSLRFSTAGTAVNQARLTNPPGPFVDPTVDDPCAGSPTDSCAVVQLSTLAVTGLDDPLRLALPALVALLLGALLALGDALRRRRLLPRA